MSYNSIIMNMNRKAIITIAIIFIMIASIGLTVFVAQKQQKTRQQAAESVSGTTPSKIKYDARQSQKEYQRFNSRTPLSPSDLEAKAGILTKPRKNGTNSGIIFENSNVSIEYISSVDFFDAQILTTDIDLAKTQAQDWLINQGLSSNGICALPLTFYLSLQARDSLPQGTIFSPSPLVCP